ncbi:transducin family protein / WD-40 repeat family protein [Perilla frutescens var. hirtella]|uniref:Transducin family protein / WD-40 repeat family protein n=1 Tax=Perilla frutescens var. hirtella TaxID=608512 RepID=A0AAD4IMC6_PERFH|nr:transducin family protein / WD-40 repeat family protein [Perilla frutescens var. hirtella]KAH6769819.1 transducin family protein / WD-40 repeat family protein [Perilla frutescens var. hirtella]KAH6816542.1 transducin family protein / WD-40 repeat family protein [Perilla frutescens var. frutescens]
MSRPRRYISAGDYTYEPAEYCRNVARGCADGDFTQITKLRSAPHMHLKRVVPGEARIPVSPVQMLVGRECNYSGRGRFSLSDCCHVLSRYLPVHGAPSVVDKMKSCVYVSQFSDDGSLFVAGFQESHIKIYDVDQGWKVHKDIHARSLRWTITDTSLSPDRRFLVYSSISPTVHIVDVGSATKQSHANVTEIHEGLEFSSNVDDYEDYSFGIFSVKFSTDGREIVAASSDDSIYVYDLQARKLSLRIPAHRSDVNAVCFADESGNIIYSGSDDHLCKVWDRRCFVTKGQAAGVLMGHLEGITFIDSRGDGRYFISNGKDQAIKLWDIRKMSSNVNYNPRRRYAEWDYRWMEYPEMARNVRLPDDLSIATYKGHTVLRTLIRCYFSPAFSTGQRYIYTGSTDSSVYVYDVLSGNQVAKLDFHEDPVRDCNWHPFYPMLVSSSWDGMIARWEFPDDGECTAPVRQVRRRRRFFY